MFEIGSAVVVGVGAEAKKDAGLAILVAALFGFVLFRFYVFILSFREGKNLFEIMGDTLGQIPGSLLTLTYVTYFLYISARVLRDFIELLIVDTFPNTPLEVLTLIFKFMSL